MDSRFIQVLTFIVAIFLKANADYGSTQSDKKSILFPDGEGKLHKVALSFPRHPVARSWFAVAKPLFWLYTRDSQNDPEIINDDDPQTLMDSHFEPDKLTKFVAHGWRSDQNSSICVNLKNTFLEVYDCNVIIIDWSDSAKKTYFFARTDLDKVARHVGKFLDFLVMEGGTSMRKVHLLGHSLGGHLIGLSSRMAKVGKPKILTALDPALPLFQKDSKKPCLSKTDGPYLEVFHTSGGFLGFMEPLGHADFYVNGGTRQPGCGLDPARVCAHMRAHVLYAELIRNPGLFSAKECGNMNEALARLCDGGERHWTDYIKWNGIYLLETSGEPPFIKAVDENYYNQYEYSDNELS